MINKIKFKLELFFLFVKKNLLFIILGIIFGIFVNIFRDQVLAIYSNLTQTTHYIGVEGLYTSKNLPYSINQLITYGITTHTQNNKADISPIINSLDIQNDNKDYLFTLKDNLYWHNNRRLEAKDIDLEIEGIEITPISSNQFKISLQKPFSPILSTLSQPLYLKNLVGLGPYKVKSIKYQDSFIDFLKLEPKDSQLQKITYKFYQNEKDLISAFKLGEVDEIEISYLPQDISTWPDISINQTIDTTSKYIAIFLNTQKLESKQLRQSLAYATPKTKNKNERCISPVSANSWAYNPSVKEYNFSASHAKELIKDNQIEEISLTVIDRRLLPTAEVIKKSWEDVLDIKVKISVSPQVNPNFDAVLAFGGIPRDPDQYYFWHSTQTATNITKLNNSRIDKLLEEGRQTFDPQERKRIYFDFQRYLLEESPAIFISYPTYYNISRK